MTLLRSNRNLECQRDLFWQIVCELTFFLNTGAQPMRLS